MIIWILRGLSGAGKSTFSQIFEDREIVSADFYHERSGKYEYKQENVQAAHSFCLREYVTFVTRRGDYCREPKHLIVDNTNIHMEYLAPYVRLAQAYEFEYYIVEFTCTLEQAIARNVHNTPEDALRRMYNAMDRVELPKSWPVVKVEDIRFKDEPYIPGVTKV